MDSIISLSAENILAHFRCGLCAGFVVDATALPECHHEFCKSCIVGYCNRSPSGPVSCPVSGCGAEIHKTRPLAKIKNDATLQTLVYKLFPNLYQDEMARRQCYYQANPDLKNTVATSEDLGVSQPLLWLSPSVPKVISLRLVFDELLAPFIELSPQLGSKRGTNVMLSLNSETTIGSVKYFLSKKHRLPDMEMIVVMYTTMVLENKLPLSDVMRFYGKGKSGICDLTLSYVFMEVNVYGDAMTREAAIIRLMRKRPFVNLHHNSTPPDINTSPQPSPSPSSRPESPKPHSNEPNTPKLTHVISSTKESANNLERSVGSEVEMFDVFSRAIVQGLADPPTDMDPDLFDRLRNRSLNAGQQPMFPQFTLPGHFRGGAPIHANVVFEASEEEKRKRLLARERAHKRRQAKAQSKSREQEMSRHLPGPNYYDSRPELMHHNYALDPRMEPVPQMQYKKRQPQLQIAPKESVPEPATSISALLAQPRVEYVREKKPTLLTIAPKMTRKAHRTKPALFGYPIPKLDLNGAPLPVPIQPRPIAPKPDSNNMSTGSGGGVVTFIKQQTAERPKLGPLLPKPLPTFSPDPSHSPLLKRLIQNRTIPEQATPSPPSTNQMMEEPSKVPGDDLWSSNESE